MKHLKTYTLDEAKHVLERYCVYQERSFRAVETKLLAMDMISEARDVIVLHLLQHDFINEERYAKAYAGGKFRINKWGRLKIKRALQREGVSKANISIGLAEIEDSVYIQTLQDLALKKKRLIRATNTYEKKQKLMRFLQQKGYESNLIYECVF